MPDLVDRILREVRERKLAAQAAYEESQRLEAALTALGDAPAVAAPPRRRQRTAAARTPRGENRRRVLEVVGERAGVSAGEVAQVTGIARPTVASTLSKLAGEGALERVERPAGGVGFKVAEPATATTTTAPAPEPEEPADTPE